MIEDEILPIVDVELWGVYDNATDKPVAYGTYDETVRMLRMTKDEFEEMLSRFENGERTFDILGKKLSVNIMVDGFVYRKKWREVSDFGGV